MKPWHAEAFEWDEANEGELARHRVSPADVENVFESSPVWVPNRKRRSGDWKMVGHTRGGRALTIVVSWDEARLVLRPVTGWNATSSDVTRYLGGER